MPARGRWSRGGRAPPCPHPMPPVWNSALCSAGDGRCAALHCAASGCAGGPRTCRSVHPDAACGSRPSNPASAACRTRRAASAGHWLQSRLTDNSLAPALADVSLFKVTDLGHVGPVTLPLPDAGLLDRSGRTASLPSLWGPDPSTSDTPRRSSRCRKPPLFRRSRPGQTRSNGCHDASPRSWNA
jgi:hypothetical protein